MPKFFDKYKSMSFVCLYLKNGQKIYRSSRLKEDKVSKEIGMKGLRKRFVNGKYKGQYHTAVIFDNNSKEILEKYDEYGKRIFKNSVENEKNIS
jgi:hypothetical protein